MPVYLGAWPGSQTYPGITVMYDATPDGAGGVLPSGKNALRDKATNIGQIRAVGGGTVDANIGGTNP